VRTLATALAGPAPSRSHGEAPRAPPAAAPRGGWLSAEAVAEHLRSRGFCVVRWASRCLACV
jgi:hypothetical protein